MCLKSAVAKQRGTADCSCILPRMVWLLASCCRNKVREPLRMICQPGRLVRNTITSWGMTSEKLPTLWTAERVFYAGLLLEVFLGEFLREEALFFLCAQQIGDQKKVQRWEIFKTRKRLASLHHSVLCNGSFSAWISSKGLLHGSYIMRCVTQGQLHVPLLKTFFWHKTWFHPSVFLLWQRRSWHVLMPSNDSVKACCWTSRSGSWAFAASHCSLCTVSQFGVSSKTKRDVFLWMKTSH